MPDSVLAPLAPLGRVVRDGAYLAVGLGVIAFQQAQVQREELTKTVQSSLGDARAQVERAAKGFEDQLRTLDERLGSLESRVEEVIEQFEENLPEQARVVVRQARDAAKSARSQVRDLIGASSAA